MRNNVDVFARVFQVDGTMCQRGEIGLARERSFGEGSGRRGFILVKMDGFRLTTHVAILAVLWEDVGGVKAKLVSS